jgi:hypothetical protein
MRVRKQFNHCHARATITSASALEGHPHARFCLEVARCSHSAADRANVFARKFDTFKVRGGAVI